jgi:hypothetical protein
MSLFCLRDSISAMFPCTMVQYAYKALRMQWMWGCGQVI